ncbi:Hsp70 family protein [Micromonospora auratinigra]|uniref:PQQ-like domain-containing protein n=1 Tax=Micromonospora auratinigra TaxID=261654 RepID=A0A1A8ZQU8_9ACTN|nr:Hsp70 family protein [Micromonospora auratinigra]SBT46202.1 PQQ-like domain-containing protein [Micromonospora auratinigra]
MSGQQDGHALGVDLGTSNTVAVLRWPDGRTRPLLVDGHPILPSGVYADTDGHLHVGRDAQRLAQADPTGYEPNPKRRVDEETVALGGRAYRPAELLAATLRAVADAAVAAVGFLPPAVVTHPAAWSPPRRQVLHDALELAGWPAAAEHTLAGPIAPGTRLLREPVAAARYYTQVLRRPVPVGGAVAVFDFGGGTLDVAVLRNEGADPWGDSGFHLVATGGVADLGGLDLDAALLRRLGELVGPAHPAQWARLTDPGSTAERRDRQQLWENVRGAKEMLSRAMVAPVAVPGVEAAVPLSRADLERLATPLLARAVAETRDVIAAAGLGPEQLSGLFLVGGSTRMPLVARLLHAELGIAPTVLEQPELPVAEGALTDLPLPRPGRPVTAVPAPAGPHGTVAERAAAETPVSGPPAGPHGTRADRAAYPAPVPAGAADTVPDGAALAGPHGTVPDGGGGYPAGPHGTLVANPTPPRPTGHPAPLGYAGAGSPWAGSPPAAPDRPPAPGNPVSPGHPALSGWSPGTGSGGPGVPPGSPVPPAPGGPARGPRARWIVLAAGLALLGVVAATAFWLLRDRHPALDFHDSLDLVKAVPAGDERPGAMFTATLADRAYLAYPLPDDRLQVVAVDTATGKPIWREPTPVAAERWAGIRALPDGVAVLADASGDSTPRPLVVLDGGDGKRRWDLSVHGDDAFYLGTGTLAWLDRSGNRLVGLRLDDGHQQWAHDNPRNEYGDARTRVLPVDTGEALDGSAYLDGSPRTPWAGRADRLVQVGADRSVRVIELAGGEVRSRPNVADVDDPLAARDDRLYVVEENQGYRLLAYDLAELGNPKVLHSSADEQTRAKSLVTCGAHRACLLEVPGAGADATKVVAVTEGEAARSWAAPKAETLVPVGEHLLAGRDSPRPTVTLFDPDGGVVLRDRPGVAVRLDAGNVLLFGESPSSGEDNRSLAGLPKNANKPHEMGELRGVRSDSCSWNTQVIVCGAEKEFVLYRFAG